MLDEGLIAGLEEAIYGEARALAVAMAKVVEKVKAPTDDEREALSEFLLTVYGHGLRPNALREADAILTFLQARHFEVSEPETVLYLTDSLKMVRETLCAVQNGANGDRWREHSGRVGRIIAEIDRQRPLGPNGKHGNLHTSTCGCEKPLGSPSRGPVDESSNDVRKREPEAGQ